MHATCPVHLNLLDLIVQYLVKCAIYEAPHYVIFCSILLLPLGVNWLGHETDDSPPYLHIIPRLRIKQLYLHFPNTSAWHGVQLSNRYFFMVWTHGMGSVIQIEVPSSLKLQSDLCLLIMLWLVHGLAWDVVSL